MSDFYLRLRPEIATFPPLTLALRASRWKRQAQYLQKQVCVAWFILRDQRTPWYARAVASMVVGYIFSPVQLIPSFIPIIGFVDDLLVLGVGMGLVRRLAPAQVIHHARCQADRAISRGSHNVKPRAVRTIIIVISTAWLLATLALFFWLWR